MMDINKDMWWGPLVLLMLLAVIGFAAYALVTGKDLTVIAIVLTALLMKLGTMLDFRYGNSKKSVQSEDTPTLKGDGSTELTRTTQTGGVTINSITEK